jgi:3-hydroxyisobutyrate dehydrogenase
MTEVAFIGLGNMGAPMARNLHKAGFGVRGFDVVEACRATARTSGLTVADSVETAVHGADVVMTMLPAGTHVLDVYRLAAPAARKGTLFIDSSTVDIESCRKAHAIAGDTGIISLDAPVSGGVGGAIAANLTFMMGGSAVAVARAEPLLKVMGARSVHCGGAGAGQAAKICNNMILGVSMIGVCEAFVLGEKLGLDHKALFDVASTSSGQCWSLTSYCPVPGPVPASPANNGYKPGFAAALMLKDLTLSQEAAAQTGAATPLGRHAQQIYEAFVGAGMGAKDFSAIIEALREGAHLAQRSN